MNNKRRKKIEQAMTLLENAKIIIQDVRDEEREALHGMPESLQSSERGMNMDAAIDMMDAVIGEIENSISSVGEASR